MGGERLQPVRHEVRSVLQPVHQTLERLVSGWRGLAVAAVGVMLEVRPAQAYTVGGPGRDHRVRFGGRAGGSLTCESPAGSDASPAASFFFTISCGQMSQANGSGRLRTITRPLFLNVY